MIEIPSLRPETRYGMPAAERVLFNRQYVVGYSYLFRQPRWALELIDDHTMQMEDEARIPTLVSILLTIGWPRTPLFMRVGKHSRR